MTFFVKGIEIDLRWQIVGIIFGMYFREVDDVIGFQV